jgi:hypothetical protein
LFSVCRLRHQRDAVGRPSQARHQRVGLGQVRCAAHDQLQIGSSRVAQGDQRLGPDAKCLRIAGIGQLRRDVPLVHARQRGGFGHDRAVGFDLDGDVRREASKELLQRPLLQQRFATGEH